MRKLLTKVLVGDTNKKSIKEIQPIVDKINSLEAEFEKLSDDKLKEKTVEFRIRLKKGETLDNVLPEAFATVREAAKRTTGMRPYDVQLIGGIFLHRGKIAEMRTGEGKTLVATLPTYLNALEGNGVHVVTVNDYLAKRDAVWMAQVYDYLGLTVGVVQNQRVSFIYDSGLRTTNYGLQSDNTDGVTEDRSLSTEDRSEGSEIDKERDETGSFKVEDEYLREASRQEVYRCDITYGTNNEFGFDYLRDNMVQDLKEMVMRPGYEMNYAIIDEVDSILIDEARTPLIISAPAAEATDQYYQFARLVTQLKENEDYNIDEKMRSATLTEDGISKFEGWLGVDNIYAEGGMRIVHHIEQALKAEVLFSNDKEYVVEGDDVVIIDEFTGRKMPGRRYSEGLHQAIEAKEGVKIQRESQTLATITFQNLFRMYNKLSGMTGTAETEAEEFGSIYGLDVVVIPTNKPDARLDNPDRIYKGDKAKYAAVVEQIKKSKAKGQPVLIGTISVEKNEELSEYLTAKGIFHEALNAKNHEREGEIIAQAGRPGSVTLATNMAGRGVDIKLGGNPVNKQEEQKVLDAGGLFVLGTERHDSRRIDNQLRGRSARQGDVGETQFYVSTNDDLMRIFAKDRIAGLMNSLPDDMPIEMRLISKALENAQKKVEGHNFDTRKHLLEYDDVLNKQRTAIYEKRRQILELATKDMSARQHDSTTTQLTEGHKEDNRPFKSLKGMILDMIEQEIEFVVSFHTNVEERKNWDVKEISETVKTMFTLTNDEREEILSMNKRQADEKFDEVKKREEIVTFLMDIGKREYEKIEEAVKQQAHSHAEKIEINPDDREKLMRSVEKGIMLRAIDTLWVEHLISIDYLRTGIGLRGYGQRDPLIEYKKETYHMFNQLQANIQKEVVYSFFKVGTGLQMAPTIMASDKMTLKGAAKTTVSEAGRVEQKPRDDEGNKVGRNDPCPCGSGKKYKKCHG
jgi:preprotein translocase subunit SecA